jgi:hypothetical protein
MSVAWDTEELAKHNRAWKQAKAEMLDSEVVTIPDGWYSTIAARAEVIRKEMKTREGA